ncbi:MAG: class I SAM-dependent methyltransferase [Methylococcaceae bacterium]|nr:MAG: class I SAM-dependent methyltransferase [Methylococcaceae bacterium]
MHPKDHWEQVYAARSTDRLGWYKPHLQTSLRWIEEIGLAMDDPIIDVGGGAATLVDDLLDEGYRAITVLDLSRAALSAVKARLGGKAERVTWLEGDIASVDLPAQRYALWHDRAVLHFLTAPEQQRAYREQLLKALKPDGHVIIGTFAPEAPPRCSGLPVQRYSLEQLQSALGREFALKRDHKELHVTPGGVEQMYLYCQFCRSD